ncbi:MAG: ABC transporter permease [Gemmatimonadota bacterium]|nr:MAG: ABC transporter permease [Gemmatimonadota bacterium]
MSALTKDIRYALRQFAKSPGFTALAVTTIALGIGANTATFTLVNSVLLNPMPFEGGERLVDIWQKGEESGAQISLTPTTEMVDAWHRRAESFDAIATYNDEEYVYVGGEMPEKLAAVTVSPSLIPLLGAAPLLGRVFSEEDAMPGAERVVLLSETFWRSRFGSDREIIGRTLTLDEQRHVVVGVLASRFQRLFEIGFFSGDSRQVWTPLSADATHEWGSAPYVLARLSPGVTVTEAQSELGVIHRQMVAEGLADEDWTPQVARLTDRIDRHVRVGLWVLLVAVGFVLLIACANLANMLLARGTTRGHELAVRLALGARRLHIARQLMTESLVLSLLGGGAGLLLAMWSVDAVVSIASNDLSELRSARIEPLVLAYTFAISLLTGLLFGLAPLVQIRSLGVNELLKIRSRTSTAGSGGSLLRQLLITAEVALALVLFLGAGLMVNSLLRLQSVDRGFESENLVSMRLSLPPSRYSDARLRSLFFENVAERLRSLPDVQAAAWARGVPPRLPAMIGSVAIEGREPGGADGSPVHTANFVSQDYFETIGAPIIRGRAFTADGETARPVVVNEAFARRYWPRGEAIGKRFRLVSQFSSGSAEEWRTIIGVTSDVKAFWLGDDPTRLQMYYPFSERVVADGVVVVRTAGDPRKLIETLKEQVWAVDPSLPVDELAFVDEAMSRTIARPRFNATVLAAFAALALFLAAIGVYGVVSLSVSQRTREIGIRIALGAQRAEINKLILGYGVRPILIGTVAGLAISLATSRFLQSLLFEVRPIDPVTYGFVVLVLGIVGAAACYLPTRRAASVDPVETLRQE